MTFDSSDNNLLLQTGSWNARFILSYLQKQ